MKRLLLHWAAAGTQLSVVKRSAGRSFGINVEQHYTISISADCIRQNILSVIVTFLFDSAIIISIPGKRASACNSTLKCCVVQDIKSNISSLSAN